MDSPVTPGSEIVRTPGPMGQEIRRFADSGLNESISKALSSLDPGAHGAVVFHGGQEGISATVVAKLGDRWSVVATDRRAWDGKFEGEAAVRFSW